MKNFYRSRLLAACIFLMILCLSAVCFYIGIYKKHLFWYIVPAFSVLNSVCALSFFASSRKNLHYKALMSENISRAEKQTVYTVPVAAVVLDEDFKIIWFNYRFKDDFPDYAEYGTSILKIADIPLKKMLNLEEDEKLEDYKYRPKHHLKEYKKLSNELSLKETILHIGNEYYSITARIPKDFKNDIVYTVFFVNVTKEITAQTELELSKPVVIIVSIDSYDEIFEEIPESEKSAVTLNLDKLLEEFIEETFGVMKKYSRDKILIIVEERYINKLIADKVKLLDDARSIRINDRISLTLSIGIGTTAKNMSESLAYAKQALEMAMGRGGDQAAIKTESGYEFYGGISKPVERRNKVRARLIANSLKNLLEQSQTVFISGHKNSDLDSVGSSVLMAALIRSLSIPCSINIVIDKKTSLSQELIKRVESDWISNTKLIKKNEVLPPPLFISPEEAKEIINYDSLLIITDTHNLKLVEEPELVSKANNIVVIDHHLKMVNYITKALIFYHEPTASSASEMVTEIVQCFNKWGKISPVQAEAALAGIMLDTKNFTAKTGVRTFEAAAFLKSLGADTTNVKKLFAADFCSYKQKYELINSARIFKNIAIAASDVLDCDMKVIAPQTADELLTIKNIAASFVLYRSNENEISVCARSYGEINVQIIAEKLGGGGHQTMAGVQFDGKSAINEISRIVKVIDEYNESRTNTNTVPIV